MIKFILSQLRRRETQPVAEMCLAWVCDPLSHPALQTMSERELADLPFRR